METFAFERRDAQPFFGFGTAAQATSYAAYLNRHASLNHFVVREPTLEESKQLRNGDLSLFSLPAALASMKRGTA